MNEKIDFQTLAEHLRKGNRRRRVAVARPFDDHTVEVVERCLAEGIADFVLVCDADSQERTRQLTEKYAQHVSTREAESTDDCARKAVAEVREGRADVLMKGTLNTDVLLRAVLDKQSGLLEKGKVMSHITLADIPEYDKLIMFADAAVVPKPTTEQFEAIVTYAIETFKKLHGEDSQPHIALIHCTEKTSEKFPHTLSYAQIKAEAESGKFEDAVIDGPMDVKTACDAESGRIKGICSPVVGNADILIFPNIESANTFYKTITLFAHAKTAGMLCGTSAPVVVASRADSTESKYCSMVLACTTA